MYVLRLIRVSLVISFLMIKPFKMSLKKRIDVDNIKDVKKSIYFKSIDN